MTLVNCLHVTFTFFMNKPKHCWQLHWNVFSPHSSLDLNLTMRIVKSKSNNLSHDLGLDIGFAQCNWRLSRWFTNSSPCIARWLRQPMCAVSCALCCVWARTGCHGFDIQFQSVTCHCVGWLFWIVICLASVGYQHTPVISLKMVKLC